jgi:tRNA(fMet)-specific endonuclease VapC
LTYALDSSTVIHYFKGRGRIGERLLAAPFPEVALPAVVLYELEVGVEKSASPEMRRAELEAFASALTLLPFGAAEAKAAARIRAALEDQGQPIGPYDILIAGTALANGASLVTTNTDEFSRVPGLAIEDWF